MRSRKILVLFILVFSIMLSSFTFYFYQVIYTSNILVDRDDRIIIIPADVTYKSLQKQLVDGGYVNDLISFGFMSRIMKYDENIKPGRYVLRRNMSNLDAVRMLRAGIQEPVNITFNNVRLIDELASRITRNIALTEKQFNEALEEFIKDNSYGFNHENIIAMFLPDTYEVFYNISGTELINRMYYEYNKFWNEERLAKASEIGFSPLEVAVLASIVQAETKKDEEAVIIAGLYINRIKKGMLLQADPTLVFALGDFSIKRVLNEHKEIDSPYNTYKYKGLPPGPINMPRVFIIDAVLNYTPSNYIFMCAKEDFSGYHYFTHSYEQHLRNANLYQRALSIEQRKARLNQSN
jgi:UPF0755 protein